MSQWNLLDELLKNSRESIVKNGDSWDIAYSFEMESGSESNPTVNYLVFTFGANEEIHPTYRKLNVIDTGNRLINLKIETLVNPTIDTLGTDISSKIINSNFNIENSFNFSMFDETSTLTDEGTRVPFSNTVIADRRSAGAEFIEREYIAPREGVIALKFSNYGTGDIKVEYSSGGHRFKL